MDTLPICEARSKQSGLKCRNFATKGKLVCHIHGGLSTGPKTEEGRLRQHMASWKHGMRSKAAIEEARQMREYIRQCKQAL
jgi:hypothetical protein